jgi:hypothetical protein
LFSISSLAASVASALFDGIMMMMTHLSLFLSTFSSIYLSLSLSF